MILNVYLKKSFCRIRMWNSRPLPPSWKNPSQISILIIWLLPFASECGQNLITWNAISYWSIVPFLSFRNLTLIWGDYHKIQRHHIDFNPASLGPLKTFLSRTVFLTVGLIKGHMNRSITHAGFQVIQQMFWVLSP